MHSWTEETDPDSTGFGRTEASGATMRCPSTNRPAFTLIELLLVIALIGLLASLLLPALARAKEKARAVKVHAELAGLGLALEMYSDDHDNQLPPVRVNCNTDLAEHWCQFPVELAREGYLPQGDRPGLAAHMVDPFNPGHTYKYATAGPCLLNDSPAGNHRLWVPDDLPAGASTNGQYYSDPLKSPVRWVVWSLGPRPESARSQHPRVPLAGESWYRRTGAGGVLVRLALRDGPQVKSP